MSFAAINSWCETLVQVLIHSLWQSAAIAGVVWLALRCLSARRARVRYAVALTGLTAVVLSSLSTWSILRLEPMPAVNPLETGAAVQTGPLAVPGQSESASPSKPDTTSTTSQRAEAGNVWVVSVVVVWLLGAGVMIARGIAALVQAQALAETEPAVTGMDIRRLEEIADELTDRLGIRRRIRLLATDRIRVPAVLGTLWPCVLIPASLLSGTPVDYWRIILAHELAHIRRYDALINLVQMIVEALLFFNPMVWWLSCQVRVEREACCDALAAIACGQPLSVARTLVEVAATLRTPPRSRSQDGEFLPASLLAMADPARASDLTDRVERLVAPDRAARPRVSWLGLAVVLLALVAVGVALQQGTDLAVRTAAELVSPKDRVERLARLQAETNGVFLAPGTREPVQAADSAAGKREGGAAREEGQDRDTQKVTVLIRTADGSPVPKGLQLVSLFVTGNSSTSKSLEVMQAEQPEYKKTFSFPPSRLRIGAVAPGWAAAASPLVSVFEGEPERMIELVLSRGATAVLHITDEQQRGIPAAELRLHARMAIGGSASGQESRIVKANDLGVALLDHIGDGEYELEVRAIGFQRADRLGPIDTSRPTEWQLTPSRPTSMQVIDATTGAPIDQARVELTSWQRSGHSSHSGDPRWHRQPGWLTFATTDATGRALLSDLRDGTSYTFGVLAPDYGMALVEDVQAGQPERTIRLTPPLTLSGRVTGSIDQLDKRGQKGAEQPYLNYQTRLTNHLSGSGSAIVDADGRISITGLIRGEQVRIVVAGHAQEFVMKESLENVELNIAPPAPAKTFPTRTVVLRFVGTSPGAPIRGNLYVDWQHPDPECRQSHNGPLPIQDNEVRMEIPVGGRLSFWPRDLAGYTVERQDGKTITAGDGPQIIDVPARAAGGIHGTIVRADGRPATNAFVTAFATRLPPGVTDHQRINPEISSASSSFLLSLPLGGRYRLLARELTDAHSVWTVSEEITLDDSRPIADVRLSLPTGRNLPVRVLDPDGHPVADQPVRLEIGFALDKGYSFSTEVVRNTGPDGLAIFENLAGNEDIAPLRLSFNFTAPPVRFQGWQARIDGHQPVEIRLGRGLSASGVLINSKSGKPIPGAEIRLVPREFRQATFKGSIRTKTDATGQFRFEGLEDLEYTAYIDGTVPKGTIVTQEGGSTRFQYPAGVVQHQLRAGMDNIRWEAFIYPGSHLRSPE